MPRGISCWLYLWLLNKCKRAPGNEICAHVVPPITELYCQLNWSIITRDVRFWVNLNPTRAKRTKVQKTSAKSTLLCALLTSRSTQNSILHFFCGTMWTPCSPSNGSPAPTVAYLRLYISIVCILGAHLRYWSICREVECRLCLHAENVQRLPTDVGWFFQRIKLWDFSLSLWKPAISSSFPHPQVILVLCVGSPLRISNHSKFKINRCLWDRVCSGSRKTKQWIRTAERSVEKQEVYKKASGLVAQYQNYQVLWSQKVLSVIAKIGISKILGNSETDIFNCTCCPFLIEMVNVEK